MSDDLKHLGIYSTQRVTYIGTGMTRRKNVQKRYWSVALDDEGKVVIQALNQNLVPSGPKRVVNDDEFHERFEFEPDIYALGMDELGKLKPLWRRSSSEAAPEEGPLKDAPPVPEDDGLAEPVSVDDDAELYEPPATEADIPPELADEDVFHLEQGKERAGQALMEELGGEPDYIEEDLSGESEPETLAAWSGAREVGPGEAPEQPSRAGMDMVEMSEEELFDILGPDKSGPEVVMTARERRLMEIEKNARADFGLGISYLRNGQTKLARKIFEDLAVLDGDFGKRHKYMFNDFGIGLRRSKMLDVALKNYLRVVELAPDDENVYHNIARIYYEKGEMDKAQDYLEKSLRINPRLGESREFLEFIKRKGRKKGKPRFSI